MSIGLTFEVFPKGKSLEMKKDYVKNRDEDPVLAIKPDPGLYTSNECRFLKVFTTNILDHIKSLLFVLILSVSDVL